MKKQLLFCCEKWCAGNPLMGLTNNFHNMFSSFSQTQNEYMFNTIHLDESALIYGANIDNILIPYCQKFKPSIIIFCLLGGSNVNPSISTYQKLKNLGIKLCFMWPDTQQWAIQNIFALKDIADLSVSWDNPVSNFHNNINWPSNYISLWTPEEKYSLHDDKKNIDVSFVGSTVYPDRHHILSKLITKRNIFIDGGQRTKQLTPESYNRIIRSSKISLNFSKSPCQTYYQTKGRVFEVLKSKGLLLESKNTSTSRFFTPGKDYIEFESLEDLDNKIEYYLKNEDERIKISTNGYNTFHKNYTSEIFWGKILKELTQ